MGVRIKRKDVEEVEVLEVLEVIFFNVTLSDSLHLLLILFLRTADLSNFLEAGVPTNSLPFDSRSLKNTAFMCLPRHLEPFLLTCSDSFLPRS